MTDNSGHHQESVPSYGGVNPEEIAADVLSTMQDAAAEEVATSGSKLLIATIHAVDNTDATVDVVREYADTNDGITYPAVNASVPPKPGDTVVAVERPGGAVIIGKAWAPGDPNLDTVRSGDDILTNAVDNRILAGGDENSERAVDTNNIKRGAVTNELLSNPNGHSHAVGGNSGNVGGHDHSCSNDGSHGHDSGGNHNHTYKTYTGATWENAKWETFNTSSDGNHGHGSAGGHNHPIGNAGGHDHAAGGYTAQSG